MSFSRNITFNNTTATISFPTRLDSSNQLNWTLTVTSGINKVSTDGSVAIESFKPTASTGLNTSWTAVTTTISPAEKDQHVSFIKEALNTIETTSGRDAKAMGAKLLYDYMFMCGLDFVNAYERYKQTTITKAYELKKEAPEKTAMITSIDKYLTAVGAPLELPAPTVLPPPPGLTRQVACGGPLTYCGCSGCPDLTVKSQTKTTEPSKPANPVVTPAVNTDAEYNLFVVMAKEHECDYIAKNPKDYFGYYQGAVKRGYITGPTVADKIEKYINNYYSTSPKFERIKLMKSLFEKNKLIYNDAAMTLYNDWQNTYKPTGPTNRYKKMCAFIDAHKSLFTPL